MNINKILFFEKSSGIQNSSYKKDTEYTIKACRLFALTVGLWPTNYRKAHKIFIHLLYYCTTMFTIISCILHGIFVIDDLHERLIAFGPVMFFTMLLFKYSLFLSHNEDIKICLSFIEEDWKVVENIKHRMVMIKRAKYGNYITILCACFIITGGLSYCLLIPLTSEPILTKKNITVQPFPAPVYGEFFTSGKSPVYEFVFTTQVFAGILNQILTVMTFSLAAVFILHSCGQFDIICEYLNNLVSNEDENYQLSHNRLVLIVKRHLRLLSFIAHLEDLLNEICLIEIVGSIILICLIGYYLIEACKEVEVSDIMAHSFLVSSYIFNVFIYCYVGDLLTRQAVKVSESACSINWYNLPKQTLQELILLIKMSQFPVGITIGKFSVLSLNSFSTVLNTSAAYFNFLWRMIQ